MKPENEQLLKLCQSLRGSGRMALQTDGGKLILRKRHYPVLVTLFCVVFMGSLSAAVIRFDGGSSAFLFAAMAALMVMIFSGCFFYLERRPPVAVFDSGGAGLQIPKLGISGGQPENIRLGYRTVYYDSDGKVKALAIYAAQSGEETGTPIHVEDGRGQRLVELIREFASRSGMGVYDLPEMDLRG